MVQQKKGDLGFKTSCRSAASVMTFLDVADYICQRWPQKSHIPYIPFKVTLTLSHQEEKFTSLPLESKWAGTSLQPVECGKSDHRGLLRPSHKMQCSLLIWTFVLGTRLPTKKLTIPRLLYCEEAECAIDTGGPSSYKSSSLSSPGPHARRVTEEVSRWSSLQVFSPEMHWTQAMPATSFRNSWLQ